ncbi:hypothetical protein M231_03076 [Tremella mesenterica]|uniref:Uncharacterized protein n=1 Tax=Tremella mesenterica TaxID=5217 RepID=A0A4Q1BNV8_TREME|nr:hypothetical protein M231_03076 [Tremella mesenterica]
MSDKKDPDMVPLQQALSAWEKEFRTHEDKLGWTNDLPELTVWTADGTQIEALGDTKILYQCWERASNTDMFPNKDELAANFLGCVLGVANLLNQGAPDPEEEEESTLAPSSPGPSF